MEINKKQFLSYANKYRGLLAITILLSHTWAYTGFRILISFNKVVTIAVFLFLFLSGLGIETSNAVKLHYREHIWKAKIPKLCFMAVEAYVFSYILEGIVSKIYEFQERQYTPFSMCSFIESTNWYVYELLIFYILFSIFSMTESKKRMIFLWGTSIILFIIFYMYAPVEAYYDSIFGFVFGVSCYKFKNWISKKYTNLIVIAAVAVSIVCMLSGNTQNIWFAVIRNVMGICAVYIIWKFYNSDNYIINRWFDTTINNKLCEISPELYFFHIPICAVFGVSVKNVYLRTGIIIIGSFVTAILVNKIHQFVRKRRRKHDTIINTKF